MCTASRSSLPSLVPFVPWITSKSPGFNCRWSCTRHHETTMETARDVKKNISIHFNKNVCLILPQTRFPKEQYITSHCKFARLCHEFAFLVLHTRCSSAFSTTPRQALQRGQIDRNLHSSARSHCFACAYSVYFCIATLCCCFQIVFSDPFWLDSWLSTTYSLTSHTCPQ